jgi:hypothetical protein
MSAMLAIVGMSLAFHYGDFWLGSEIMKAFFQHFFLPISTIVFHRAACSSAQVP